MGLIKPPPFVRFAGYGDGSTLSTDASVDNPTFGGNPAQVVLPPGLWKLEYSFNLLFGAVNFTFRCTLTAALAEQDDFTGLAMGPSTRDINKYTDDSYGFAHTYHGMYSTSSGVTLKLFIFFSEAHTGDISVESTYITATYQGPPT